MFYVRLNALHTLDILFLILQNLKFNFTGFMIVREDMKIKYKNRRNLSKWSNYVLLWCWSTFLNLFYYKKETAFEKSNFDQIKPINFILEQI